MSHLESLYRSGHVKFRRLRSAEIEPGSPFQVTNAEAWLISSLCKFLEQLIRQSNENPRRVSCTNGLHAEGCLCSAVEKKKNNDQKKKNQQKQRMGRFGILHHLKSRCYIN